MIFSSGFAAMATIIFLVAACFILGRLIIIPFTQRTGQFSGDWLSLLFASLALGVAVTGWLALLLAELGWFSIGLLSGLWLLLVLVLGVVAIRGRKEGSPSASIRVPEKPPSSRFNIPSWLQYPLLVVWLLAASWLFFRPHEYVTGAADAGVYVNLAANISNSGAILIDDPTLAELDPALYPAVLRPLPDREYASRVAPYYLLPGFYVPGSPAGQIIPQFYPLHAVWQAIAFSLGGVRAALLMTGLWGLLGGMAIYLVGRRIAGWEAAFLALTGLTINALQVWFARYPTTEPLTQFLLWSAVWSMMIWLQDEEPAPLWGFLAGLTLGELFLVRIDTYFLLALPFVIWFYLRWSGRWRREHWWFYIPLGLLTFHSLLHALWQSRPYFFSIFGYGVGLLRRNWTLVAAAIIFGAAIILVLGVYRNQMDRLKRWRRPVVWAAVAAVILLAAYGWFIRPNLGLPEGVSEYWYGGEQIPAGLDRENLVRLGWYLTPFGIALATAGICLMLLEIDRQKAIILSVGLIFSLIYLWRIQANPHQIYTMRRYVPAVLPFAMIATGYLFGWLFQRKFAWLQAIGVVLALVWLFALAQAAQDFIRQVDHEGLITQLEAMDEQLAANSILIFNDQSILPDGDFIGTPLRFLFGHDVFSIRDQDALDVAALRATIRQWRNTGRQVYWIGDATPLERLDLKGGAPFEVTIRSQQLEGRYDRKPEELSTPVWELYITPIE